MFTFIAVVMIVLMMLMGTGLGDDRNRSDNMKPGRHNNEDRRNNFDSDYFD